jgi:hypothetical protein
VTKLKMNITTKEDLKAENGRLKRELEVREKAIKDLEMKIEDEYVPKKDYEVLKVQSDDRFKRFLMAGNESSKHIELYHKEHSLVIQLDAELENSRDQYRKVISHNVNLTKENEHLWGLLKIKMEG